MTGVMQAFGGANMVVLQAQAVDLTIGLGSALMFFGLSLVVWGFFGLGKVDGRSAGVISTIAGALAVVWAALVIVPSDPATAAVVGAFGFAFLSAGGHTFFGVDLGGHGILCLVLAGMTAIVAVTFTLAGGTPFLTIALWSYVAVLIGFFGGAYYGTDRWLQVFTATSFLTGILTTGLFGTLLILGHVSF